MPVAHKAKPRGATGTRSTTNTKASILEASIYCFERYGIEKTSIEDIMKESGLSRPTIYRYFANKEHIVHEVGLEKAREINRLVAMRVAKVTDPMDKIAEAMMASINALRQNKLSLLLLRNQSAQDATQQADRAAEIIILHETRWKPILTLAMEASVLRTDINMRELISWLTFMQMAMALRAEALGHTQRIVRKYIRQFLFEGLLIR